MWDERVKVDIIDVKFRMKICYFFCTQEEKKIREKLIFTTICDSTQCRVGVGEVIFYALI